MKKNNSFLFLISVLVLGTAVAYVSFRPALAPETVTEGHALLAQYDKADLIGQSDAIVIARVAGMHSVVAPSDFRPEAKDIVTEVTLDVEKYLRDDQTDLPKILIVRVPGGTRGATSMHIDGAAQFADGERALVFLSETSGDAFEVYGWMEGKYGIRDDGVIGNSPSERERFLAMFGDVSLSQIEKEIAAYGPLPHDAVSNSVSSEAPAPDANARAAAVIKEEK